eukprot:Skav225196  [mRNA]  locus=scaffold3065:250317:257428:+ [translate_table: standard]
MGEASIDPPGDPLGLSVALRSLSERSSPRRRWSSVEVCWDWKLPRRLAAYDLGLETTILEEILPSTLLIVGAGVRPRQELAESCGLELGSRGGIKAWKLWGLRAGVDHRMKTATDEHIWAVGEIASYNGGMCYQLSAPGARDHPGADGKFNDADLSTKLKLLGEEVMSKVSKDHDLFADISAFAPLTAVSKRADIGGLSPDELMAGQMPKVDDGGDGTNLGDDDHVPWQPRWEFSRWELRSGVPSLHARVCNCHSVPKKARPGMMQRSSGVDEMRPAWSCGSMDVYRNEGESRTIKATS